MPVATSTKSPEAVAGWRRWVRTPIYAALIVLLVYVGLSFLNDPRGSLGTDTGGKTASLVMMDRRGDLDPDVGYWAEAQDPTARIHGLYTTTRFGDRFVNTTSPLSWEIVMSAQGTGTKLLSSALRTTAHTMRPEPPSMTSL